MAKAKGKPKGKSKQKKKETVRRDSPRRALTVMAEKCEECMDSLRAAASYVEEGDYADAITSICGAQSAKEWISSTLMENAILDLENAHGAREKILERMNR